MTKVPIKGIKVYWSGGKRYAYHRPTKTPLKAPYGTPQFFAELAEIERKYRERRGQAATAKPGTWGALVVQYKEHRLPQLARRTQADYHKFLDWLSPLDGMPLSDWSRGFAIKLRDKAFKQHGRRFANYVISVVQAVFSWGLERDYVTKHPVQNVKAIERPKDMKRANRPWARSEWDVVIAEAPKHLLAPILLCGVLGWREGEAVNRPRNDYDRDSKRIKRTSAKSGKVVKTPVPKIVSDVLDDLFPHDAVTLLVNSRGASWTENGFRSLPATLHAGGHSTRPVHRRLACTATGCGMVYRAVGASCFARRSTGAKAPPPRLPLHSCFAIRSGTDARWLGV